MSSQSVIERATPEEEISDSGNEEQPSHLNRARSERHSVEPGARYETFDRLHAEMARLWKQVAVLSTLSPERKAIILRIDELREQAYQAIPHEPCGPNTGSYGRVRR